MSRGALSYNPGSQKRPAGPNGVAENQKTESMKLIREMPDLFRLVGRLSINSYFVREDDGLTLVDASLPGRATQIVEIALRLELPIRRIVLTHAHRDHTGSLDAICELLPSAEVFIGARESRLLEEDFSLDRTEPQMKIRGRFAPVKTKPSLLDPGDHVVSLRALSTPGHTPGHFSFFDERNGALLAGDAFQTAGGLAVAGDTRLLFPFPGIFTWNKQLAFESAVVLRNLNPTCLAPGHGRVLQLPLARIDRALRRAARNLGQ
jgi:glyoxylase-like metal-dependent hydrolase (beta-lactamase superfamily II)